MKSFFVKLAGALRDMFTSKKFITAAGATIGSIAAGQDPKTAILAGGLTYVGAQGLADFGKNARPPQ